MNKRVCVTCPYCGHTEFITVEGYYDSGLIECIGDDTNYCGRTYAYQISFQPQVKIYNLTEVKNNE